ncbi:anhydro-N-acetylmuramic acid kinase [Octadecabacter temperatus]|uniref:Anhydro-N-acetylmuramic acid kinase n=1 Tax=Octadecabacter temperatus TaxID=1458307 RepID=A0A0K0Y5P5_9RHOB|nr:anhydro-N-acetylmuramic acid kinase [Octadecabacter temperatus]AKS46182.1 Anhydro-N-acetylmuramic acid kinase [Octadecabacter temperatus]SIO09161.1 anhydro-N-acetylmuramic acid kinase [Octadecabacter temperatus]
MLKDQVVRVVGAMSGTSLDGVDAAEIVTDGREHLEFGETTFRPYTDAQTAVLRAALGKWPEDDVSVAAELVETVHAQVLSGFSDAELIGFHGQTFAHDPKGRGTHQAGDGAVLAEVLGKPVVWDFRSADVQMGGEGAPLAPFYHFALAKKMQVDAPVAILNLGGVGNLTWIDPCMPLPESEGALLAFDTGPANAPINDLMQTRLRRAFDEDGAFGAKGVIDQGVVDQFLQQPFFFRMPPKSLDRDAFAGLSAAVENLSDEDAVATLTMACAASVAQGVQACPHAPERILVTGGGRRNPTLMRMLALVCDVPVGPIEHAGFDGDMLEAQAFAYLAVRVAKGLPTSAPATTGVGAAIGGGIISRPG